MDEPERTDDALLPDGVLAELGTALSIAFPLLPGVLATLEGAPNRLYEHHYRQVNFALDRLGLDLAARIERLGGRETIPVDLHLVTATNRDLERMIAEGEFREDLYYRLDVVRLHLPPLAERRDDIPMLAYYFLRKHAARIGKDVEDIGPEAMAALVEYGYPGNIRELENIIERAVTLTRSKELTIRDLPPSLADHNLQVVREKEGRLPTLAEREEEYIRYVLDHCGQNRTRAAAILGIDRVSLWRKLKKYGMSEEEES